MEAVAAAAPATATDVDIVGARDFLMAKSFLEARCLASQTSESSDLPMTRSKSKAREKEKVSGQRSEGEGSRSVDEAAVT